MKALVVWIVIILLLLPEALAVPSLLTYSDSPFLSNALPSYKAEVEVQQYFSQGNYSQILVIENGSYNSSLAKVESHLSLLPGAIVVTPYQVIDQEYSQYQVYREALLPAVAQNLTVSYQELHNLYLALYQEREALLSQLNQTEYVLNVTFGDPLGKFPPVQGYLELYHRLDGGSPSPNLTAARLAGEYYFNTSVVEKFGFNNYTNRDAILSVLPNSYLYNISTPQDFAQYFSKVLGVPVNSTLLLHPSLAGDYAGVILSRLFPPPDNQSLLSQFHAGDTWVFLVEVPKNESLTDVIAYMQSTEGTVTGHLPIYADSEYFTQGQIEVIDVTTVLLVGVLLVLLLRALVPILVLVGTAGVGIELAYAFIFWAHYLGYQVYYISSLVAVPVVFGITIDYTILVLYRYFEGLRGGSKDPLGEAYSRGGRAVLVSGISVLIGFSAFVISPSLLLRNIGIALVSGTAASLLSSLLFSRAVISVISPRSLAFPRKEVPNPYDVRQKFLGASAKWAISHKFIVLSAIVLVSLGSFLFVQHVTTNVSVAQIVPPQAESLRGLQELTNLYHYSQECVILPGDPNTSYTSVLNFSSTLINKGYLVFGPASVGNRTIPQPTGLVNMFYSPQGNVTLLRVLIPYPVFSDQAVNATVQVQQEASRLHGIVGGATPQRIDIVNQTTEVYFTFTLPLTIISILLYVSLLLRSALTPPRLVLTVLSSSLFGVAFSEIFFSPYWLTPPVVFALMFSLGIDYDVFLVLRVLEEGGTEEERIIKGVERTGLVITAAGLIMGGAFLSLLSSNMEFLREIGLAVGVSVLFDAFVVRSFFVPGIMAILKRYNWWPGRHENVTAGETEA